MESWYAVVVDTGSVGVGSKTGVFVVSSRGKGRVKYRRSEEVGRDL